MTLTAGTLTHLDAQTRDADPAGILDAVLDLLDLVVKRSLTVEEIRDRALLLLPRVAEAQLEAQCPVELTDTDEALHDLRVRVAVLERLAGVGGAR